MDMIVEERDIVEKVENENDNLGNIERELISIKEELIGLKDLFIRRLNDDKQKAHLISVLEEEAKFAFIEPFISDIILVLDRIENVEDDFAKSIYDELYDILNRRGVERISVVSEFDPALFKAMKTQKNPNVDTVKISKLVSPEGYLITDRVVG